MSVVEKDCLCALLVGKAAAFNTNVTTRVNAAGHSLYSAPYRRNRTLPILSVAWIQD